MRHAAILMLVLVLGGAACDDDDDPKTPPIPATPIAPSPPPAPAPRTPDVIQFRAIGDLPLVTIRTHTPADGTQQARTDLPYVATTTTTADSLFISMDAIGTGTGFLQIQIVVNGYVIREAYANGFPDPRLSLSLIYRRGLPALDVGP